MHQCQFPPVFLVACILSAPLFYIPVVISKGMGGGEEAITQKNLSSPSYSTSLTVHIPFSLLSPIFLSHGTWASCLPVPWDLKVWNHTLFFFFLRPHTLEERVPLLQPWSYTVPPVGPSLSYLLPILAKPGTGEDSHPIIRILLHRPERYFKKSWAKKW